LVPEQAKRGLGASNCSGIGRLARRHLYQLRNLAPPSL
jgi:hypothetical protein